MTNRITLILGKMTIDRQLEDADKTSQVLLAAAASLGINTDQSDEEVLGDLVDSWLSDAERRGIERMASIDVDQYRKEKLSHLKAEYAVGKRPTDPEPEIDPKLLPTQEAATR